jgi:hypothetical protein
MTGSRSPRLRRLTTLLALLSFATSALPGSAAPREALSVKSLLHRGAGLDRTVVNVRGILSVDEHGLINLYSGDRDVCVGLLLTRAQLARYSTWHGSRALVTGTFESEGCGRDGFCDEHLCGPAILTGVTISSPGSR